jgi:predicted DNA-binding transcriptional regulator AlpA
MSAGDLLDVESLAALLGLKPSTVARYTTAEPHRLPPRIKWSTKRLWRRSVVEQWMAERESTIESEEPKKRGAGRPRHVDKPFAEAV